MAAKSEPPARAAVGLASFTHMLNLSRRWPRTLVAQRARRRHAGKSEPPPLLVPEESDLLSIDIDRNGYRACEPPRNFVRMPNGRPECFAPLVPFAIGAKPRLRIWRAAFGLWGKYGDSALLLSGEG
jgi:hypothetical protein